MKLYIAILLILCCSSLCSCSFLKKLIKNVQKANCSDFNVFKHHNQNKLNKISTIIAPKSNENKLDNVKNLSRVPTINNNTTNINIIQNQTIYLWIQKTKKQLYNPSSLSRISLMMMLFYATLGSTLPYLPIYFRQIGIPENHIGTMGAITPAITFLITPFWGMLADTTNQHKKIMIFTFLGSIIFRCLLIVNNHNIIWLSIIMILTAILNAPVKPLMDTEVMSMLTDKANYGKTRLFGQLGFGFGSIIVANLISNRMDLVFLIHALLSIPTLYLMSSFQSNKSKITNNIINNNNNTLIIKNEKKNEKKIINNKTKIKAIKIDSAVAIVDKHNMRHALQLTLTNPNILIFFTIVFLIGISSGIIENFAYVRLMELSHNNNIQNTGFILGSSRLISSLAGGPMFWLSGSITKAIGVNSILTLSLISYVLRFYIYATVKHPWHALPAELLRGVTFAMFWSAATYYVYNSSPKGLTATMVSYTIILHSLFISQSTGLLIEIKRTMNYVFYHSKQ